MLVHHMNDNMESHLHWLIQVVMPKLNASNVPNKHPFVIVRIVLLSHKIPLYSFLH
ncbi:unnamed protein product [Brugia timori]|uniref:Ovule protein n=1 Tax=Brugia timori TaxID=42155 RepID=A0A0R3R4L9_9BILA|nr:unnamed protein product [Brugia timori]